MQKRVLVVDDEVAIVEGLTAFFQIKDIPTAGAFDCDGAVRMLGDVFYPVVIADLCLHTPAEGLRLLDEIRERSPRSRVVVMSGYVTPEREEELLASGVSLVLHKPAPTEAILHAVEALLAEIECVAEELASDDLEQLYVTVRRRLLDVSRHRFHLTTDRAEDVLQDAWLLFLQKRGLIRSATPWLAGTVANLCRQQIDRSIRRREVAEDEALTESLVDRRHGNPSDVLAVRDAIEKLDDRARMLFTLIAFEGRSYEEVSAATGLRLGSIGPLYIRAKEKLRKALEH